MADDDYEKVTIGHKCACGKSADAVEKDNQIRDLLTEAERHLRRPGQADIKATLINVIAALWLIHDK
jgi:hypothetical protein